MDGRRRGLKSLELGSPLRLAQLCSERLWRLQLGEGVLGFRGCSNHRPEIVIDHNISPHSWPRQPLSHSRQYASPTLLGVRKSIGSAAAVGSQPLVVCQSSIYVRSVHSHRRWRRFSQLVHRLVASRGVAFGSDEG